MHRITYAQPRLPAARRALSRLLERSQIIDQDARPHVASAHWHPGAAWMVDHEGLTHDIPGPIAEEINAAA